MRLERISIIGSGNVATHLAQGLYAQGHRINQVLSRRLSHAQNLATQIDADGIDDWNDFDINIDLLIIAVSDNAIELVADRLTSFDINNVLIVHTSGSVASSVLAKSCAMFGVFYPLQSFTKEKAIELSDVPFCIHASDSAAHQALMILASSLSDHVTAINDAEREQLHLAAVFANNFSNHMLTIAKSLCDERQLDWTILHPLLREGLKKTLEIGPENAQTGPAKRNDDNTINKQLSALKSQSDWQQIYKLISDDIRSVG